MKKSDRFVRYRGEKIQPKRIYRKKKTDFSRHLRTFVFIAIGNLRNYNRAPRYYPLARREHAPAAGSPVTLSMDVKHFAPIMR